MKVLIVLSVFGVCALAQFHGAPHHHHPGHHHPPRPTGRPMMPHGPMGIHHPMSGRPTGRPHHMLHGAAQFWQNMRDRVEAWRKFHQDQTDVEEDETAILGNGLGDHVRGFKTDVKQLLNIRPTGRPFHISSLIKELNKKYKKALETLKEMRPTGRPGGISGLEQSYIYQGHKLALKNYYKKTHKTLALNRAAPSDEDETVILSGKSWSDFFGKDDSEKDIWGKDDSEKDIWGKDDSEKDIWGKDDSEKDIWRKDHFNDYFDTLKEKYHKLMSHRPTGRPVNWRPTGRPQYAGKSWFSYFNNIHDFWKHH